MMLPRVPILIKANWVHTSLQKKQTFNRRHYASFNLNWKNQIWHLQIHREKWRKGFLMQQYYKRPSHAGHLLPKALLVVLDSLCASHRCARCVGSVSFLVTESPEKQRNRHAESSAFCQWATVLEKYNQAPATNTSLFGLMCPSNIYWTLQGRWECNTKAAK